MKNEICANCEHVIGKLEQAYIYKGNIVCKLCYNRLDLKEENNVSWRRADNFHQKPAYTITAPQTERCPFCSGNIMDGARICIHCGRKIRKSPAVAAILNYLFWGAGYIYCGRQWGIAILIPFIVLMLASLGQGYTSPTLPEIIIVNLPGIAMAWHAYNIVQRDRVRRKHRMT